MNKQNSPIIIINHLIPIMYVLYVGMEQSLDP